MRASRLLSILILLQHRARLTADALAQEFGVSERTIYRDIDELGAAGIPVIGDRGPGGGFRLLEGYRTKLTGLTPDEAETMFLVGLPEAANQLGLGEASSRAGGKLLASLPGNSAALASRLATRFLVDPVDWYRAADAVTHLPALTRAVLDQRTVEMTYESWTGVKRRTVDPIGLVLKAGTWYLAGRTGARMLTFKVTGIRDMTVLSRSFAWPEGFDLARHWRDSLERFEAGLRPGTANLRLTAEGRRRLAELGRYAADAVAAAGKPDRQGRARVTLPIENPEQAARLVLSLGEEAEALGPPEVREAVRALAMHMTRTHLPSNKEKR